MTKQNTSRIHYLHPYRRWDIETQLDGSGSYTVTVTFPDGTEHVLPPVTRLLDVPDHAAAWIDAHLGDGVVLQLARVRSVAGKPLNISVKSHIVHPDGGVSLCGKELLPEYYQFYELASGVKLRKLHIDAIGCEGCWEAYADDNPVSGWGEHEEDFGEGWV